MQDHQSDNPDLLTKEEVFQAFLAILNEAFTADELAMHNLITSRVACTNDNLLDHPEIVVDAEPGKPVKIGAIGLINGICDRLTGRKVAMRLEDMNYRLVGFQEYRSQPQQP